MSSAKSPNTKGYTVFNVEQIDGLPEIYYAKAAATLDPVAASTAPNNSCTRPGAKNRPRRKPRLLQPLDRRRANAAV